MIDLKAAKLINFTAYCSSSSIPN